MNNKRHKIIKILPLLFGVVFGVFAFVSAAFALDTGLSYGTLTGLGTQDLRVTVMSIIRAVLGFLGVVALLIVFYGGWVWMTAAGNATRIELAKRILTSAVIGLVIIFTSFAIVSFIINQLIDATGAQTPGGGFSCSANSCVSCNERCNGAGNGTFADATCNTGALCSTPTPSCPKPSTPTPTICEVEHTRDPLGPGGVHRGAAGDYVSVTGWYFGDYVAGVSQVDFDGTVAEIVSCSANPIWYENPASGASLTRIEVPTLPTGVQYDVSLTNAVTGQVSGPEQYIVAAGDPIPQLACITPPLGENNETLVEAEGNNFDTVPGELTFFDNQNASFTLWANDVITEPVVPAFAISGNVTVTDASANQSNGVFFSVTCSGNSDCSTGCCAGFVCADPIACLPATEIPVITDVSPGDGAPGNLITIFGANFDTVPGEVYFSNDFGQPVVQAQLASAVNGLCTSVWSDNQIIVEVPTGVTVDDGPIRVVRASNGAADRTDDANGPGIADFDINSIVRPGLCQITPNTGAPSTGITLDGITLSNADEVRFGAVLAGGNPSSTNLQVLGATVPNLNPATVGVRVVDGASGEFSNPLNFTVTGTGGGGPTQSCSTDPLVCDPDPSLCDDGYQCNLATCGCEEIDGGDPTGIFCDGDLSNNTPVVQCDPDNTFCPNGFACSPSSCFCEATGDSAPTASTYTFFFNTTSFGPQVLENCNRVSTCDPNTHSSPSPFSRNGTNAMGYNVSFARPDDNEVGVDSVVRVLFTSEMYIPSLDGTDGTNVIVEECDGTPPGLTNCTAINGSIIADNNAVSGGDTVGQVIFTPTGLLTTDTWYQVRLVASQIYGDTGVSLSPNHPPTGEYRWVFKTKASDQLSVVGCVYVDPAVATLYFQGATEDYDAFPSAEDNVCVDIRPESCDLGWTWSSGDTGKATVVQSDTKPNQAVATAVDETFPGFVDINAQCNLSGIPDVTGTGNLYINFTNPVVINKFPNCGAACLNAKIGATFSMPMDDGTVADATSLHVCYDDPNCDATIANEVPTFSGVSPDPIEAPNTYTGVTTCFDVDGVGGDDYCLLPNTYYRVVIKDIAVSLGEGENLAGLNYDSDGDEVDDSYTWVFKTQADFGLCLPTDIGMNPADHLADFNSQVLYSARPFVSTNSCDGGNHRLNPYSWSWEWLSTASNIADLNAPLRSACGNFIIDLGEDCDDGNTSSGDGCSNICTHEGGLPTCGNGILDQFEECENGDPYCVDCLLTGNSNDFDVCGNGVIEPSEMCENPGVGGCSADCRYAGSILGQSICGDGQIGPGEECDDGEFLNNASGPVGGDGCNTICLVEVRSDGYCRNDNTLKFDFNAGVCIPGDCDDGYTCTPLEPDVPGNSNTGPVCGNGRIEVGEECDAGDTFYGFCSDDPRQDCNVDADCGGINPTCISDGCSSECLNLGSVYETAFFTPAVTGPHQIADTFSTPGVTFIEANVEGANPPVGRGRLQVGSGGFGGDGPSIIQRFPDCGTACINATIGANFDPAWVIDGDTLNTTNIQMYDCGTDSGCNINTATPLGVTVEKPVAPAVVNRFRLSLPAGYNPTDFDDNGTIDGEALLPNTYYRVVVKDGVLSTSFNSSPQVASLVGLNFDSNGDTFDDAHSWIFRTKPNFELCSVGRIEVDEDDLILPSGLQEPYFAQPWTSPDACDPLHGQRLNPYFYDWSWQVADVDGIDAANLVTPLRDGCGNTYIERGEDCDDGNLFSGDGCSELCLNEGSQSVPSSVCGNGIVEFGEDCDDDNTVSGDGCSGTGAFPGECLFEGNINYDASVCGNGLVEPGEQCDTGSEPHGFDGDGCTDVCTFSGAVPGGDAICGDGQVTLGETCDTGELAQGLQPTTGDVGSCTGFNDPDSICDFTTAAGCATEIVSCYWTGSSCQIRACLSEDILADDSDIGNNNYGASVCGNGVIEYGEECDNIFEPNGNDNDGCTDICTNSGSYYTQNDPPNVGPVQLVQTLNVSALEEVNEEIRAWHTFTPNVVGVAQLTVIAGVEVPFAVVGHQPLPGADNQCRNVAMWAIFSRALDLDTLNTSENPDTLQLCEGDCDDGENLIEDLSYRLVQGQCIDNACDYGAQADAGPFGFCRTDFDCRGSKVTIQRLNTPTGFLDANTSYELWVDQTRLVGEGLDPDFDTLSEAGTCTNGGDTDCEWSFSTNNDFCSCDFTGVTVDYTSGGNHTVNDLFTCADNTCGQDTPLILDDDAADNFPVGAGEENLPGNQHFYQATCYDINNPTGKSIPLAPQGIGFQWEDIDPDGLIYLTDPDVSPTDLYNDASYVTPGEDPGTPAGKNGTSEVQIVAQEYVCQNNGFLCADPLNPSAECGACLPQIATKQFVKVTNFICDNPWPSIIDGLFYRDSESTGTIPDTNFTFFYCRDNGADGFDDDLPALEYPGAAFPGATVNSLKEFLFPVAETGDAEGIGMRVLRNPLNLSPETWYRSGLCGGSPTIENICFSNADCGSVDGTLVAHYTLDSGGTDVARGNNAAVNGAIEFLPGQVGSAANFQNQAGEYLEASSDNTKLTGAFTVSAWVRPKAVLPGDGLGNVIVSNYDWNGGGDGFGWTLGDDYGSTDDISLLVHGPGGTFAGSYVLNFFSNYFDTWTHITGTYKPGESIKLYINGVLFADQQNNVPSSVAYNDTPLRIGHRADNETQGAWNGLIDDVRVYARELAPAEIRALANQRSNECQFNVPERGGISSFNIDGYEAIRDGRTVYVGATNRTNGQVYSNIYLLSFDEDQGGAAGEIFNRITDQSGQQGVWQFNNNFTNHRVCNVYGFYEGTDIVCTGVGTNNLVQCTGAFCDGNSNGTIEPGENTVCSPNDSGACGGNPSICIVRNQQSCNAATDTYGCFWSADFGGCQALTCEPIYCTSDFECPDFAAGCSADKEQLVRDQKRYSDLRDIQLALENTRNRDGVYPTLGGGTYFASTTFSVWPSWQQTLGRTIGSGLFTDPINRFIGCSAHFCDDNRDGSIDASEATSCTPGDAAACGNKPQYCLPQDPDQQITCWEEVSQQFFCPVEGYTYGYRAADEGRAYELYTTFEYTSVGSWRTRPGYYCDLDDNGAIDLAEAVTSNACNQAGPPTCTFECLEGPLYEMPVGNDPVCTTIPNFEISRKNAVFNTTFIAECAEKWCWGADDPSQNGLTQCSASANCVAAGLGANSYCTGDADQDGVCDTGNTDNCAPKDSCLANPKGCFNPDQLDTDGDGLGDVCDLDCAGDVDNDGICDSLDNCRTVGNAGQEDYDGDGIGDVCDVCTDADGDGWWDLNTGANDPAVCQGRDNCSPLLKGICKDDSGVPTGERCAVIGGACAGGGTCRNPFGVSATSPSVSEDRRMYCHSSFGSTVSTFNAYEEPLNLPQEIGTVVEVTHPVGSSGPLLNRLTFIDGDGDIAVFDSNTGTFSNAANLHTDFGLPQVVKPIAATYKPIGAPNTLLAYLSTNGLLSIWNGAASGGGAFGAVINLHNEFGLDNSITNITAVYHPLSGGSPDLSKLAVLDTDGDIAIFDSTVPNPNGGLGYFGAKFNLHTSFGLPQGDGDDGIGDITVVYHPVVGGAPVYTQLVLVDTEGDAAIFNFFDNSFGEVFNLQDSGLLPANIGTLSAVYEPVGSNTLLAFLDTNGDIALLDGSSSAITPIACTQSAPQVGVCPAGETCCPTSAPTCAKPAGELKSYYNPFQEDFDNDGVGYICDDCIDFDGDHFGDYTFFVNSTAGLANPSLINDLTAQQLQHFQGCRGTSGGVVDYSQLQDFPVITGGELSDLDNCPGGPGGPDCYDGFGVPVSCKNIDQADANGDFVGDICQLGGGACGNGLIEAGEVCDNGTANNFKCTPSPAYDNGNPGGHSCSWCLNCQELIEETSGFCGDGVAQYQNEACDDGGNTDPNDPLNVCDNTCQSLTAGVDFCSITGDYAQAPLLFSGNQTSFDFGNGTSAGLVMPECSSISQASFTLRMYDLANPTQSPPPPSTGVVFVTDLSGSMESHMAALRTALKGSITSLFGSDVGDLVYVGLVSYSSGSSNSVSANGGCPGGDGLGWLCPGNDQSWLGSIIDGYNAAGATRPDRGLEQAKSILDGSGVDVGIIVLMSDGQCSGVTECQNICTLFGGCGTPTCSDGLVYVDGSFEQNACGFFGNNEQWECSCEIPAENSADDLKNAGYSVYSVGFGDGADLTLLNSLSSGSDATCDTPSGDDDYCFSGDDLASVYSTVTQTVLDRLGFPIAISTPGANTSRNFDPHDQDTTYPGFIVNLNDSMCTIANPQMTVWNLNNDVGAVLSDGLITFCPSCDADGDLQFAAACGGPDCNDSNPLVKGQPNSVEAANCFDGLDNDCNGLIDGEDILACGDIAGLGEICNDGIDNDGDGAVDCADTDGCAGEIGPNGVRCCVNDTNCSACNECGDANFCIFQNGNNGNDCQEACTYCSFGSCVSRSIGDASECFVGGGGAPATCQPNPFSTGPDLVCTTVSDENCSNGLDDDGDGLVDCQDLNSCGGQVGPTGAVCCSTNAHCATTNSCSSCNIGTNNCEPYTGPQGFDGPGGTNSCNSACDRCDNGACVPRNIFDGTECIADQSCQPDGGGGLVCQVNPTSQTDNDGDGWVESVDCNDNNAAINPGVVESCTDGVDNDCDGNIDAADSDCSTGGEICDDNLDNDGDGFIDCVDFDCAGQANGNGQICCGTSGGPSDAFCGACNVCGAGNVCQQQGNVADGNLCVGECSQCISGSCVPRSDGVECSTSGEVCQPDGGVPSGAPGFGLSCQPTDDTIAPSINITTPSIDPFNTNSDVLAALVGQASDNNSLASVDWANAATGDSGSTTLTGNIWNATSIPLDAGNNLITVTATDAAGNTNTDTVLVIYTPLDTQSPVLSINTVGGITVAGSSVTVSNGTVNVNGTATDNVGVVQVAWGNTTTGDDGFLNLNGANWTISGMTLVQGSNPLVMTATDAAGNTVSANVNIIYSAPDTQAPSVTIQKVEGINATTEPWEVDIDDVSVSGIASDNVGVVNLAFENETTGVTSVVSGTANWSVSSVILAQGSNQIKITATDLAGNSSDDQLTINYVINDPDAPTTTASPLGGSYTSVQTVTLTADDLQGNVASIWWGTAPAGNNCTPGNNTPGDTVTVSITTSSELCFYAVDTSGNTEVLNQETYYIDSIAPVTTASPAGNTYQSTQNVSLFANEPVQNTMYCIGAGCTPNQTYAAGTPIVISADAVLRFRSTDIAGNVEAIKTQTYTIDGTAPITTASHDSAEYFSPIDVNLFVVNSEPGTVTIRYCFGAGCTPGTVYGPTLNITGSAILRFYATDQAGNVESPVNERVYTITNDPNPPVSWANPAGDAGPFNSSQSVVLNVNEPADIFYCIGVGCSPTTEYTTGEIISITSNNTICYYAVDLAGNTEAVHCDNYVIDTTPPVTTPTPAPPGPFQDSVTITFSANEPVQFTRHCQGVGCTPNQTGALTINTPGFVDVSFYSVDDAGNVEATQTVTYEIVTCLGGDSDNDGVCNDIDVCPYDPNDDFDGDGQCAVGCTSGPSQFGSKSNGFICDGNASNVVYDTCIGSSCTQANSCRAIFGARDYFNLFIDGVLVVGNLNIPRYTTGNPAGQPIDSVAFNVDEVLSANTTHVIGLEGWDNQDFRKGFRGVFADFNDTGVCDLIALNTSVGVMQKSTSPWNGAFLDGFPPLCTNFTGAAAVNTLDLAWSSDPGFNVSGWGTSISGSDESTSALYQRLWDDNTAVVSTPELWEIYESPLPVWASGGYSTGDSHVYCRYVVTE